MNTNPSPWHRLTAAARQAPDERDLTLPYGFSTRVAAMAMTAPTPNMLIQRLSLRALGVAGLLMVATIAANAGPILAALQDEAASLGDSAATSESGDLS